MLALSGKKILLGVSGGIAAYKACDIVRRLRDQGADIYVVMTKAATQFITPFTLQVLSGHEVYVQLFDLEQESKISHIQLADMPDLILIAPATADLMAKMVQGICDDLLTTLLCATRAPILICPSMNVNMWNHVATQLNVKSLKERNVEVMLPASGSLACGWEGAGRLPEIEEIISEVLLQFQVSSLRGKKILITAGPTWEAIDPVRYITNPSTGKMGYAVAEAARKRGAEVVLVSGPTSLPPPTQVRTLKVKTAIEMQREVVKEFEEADIFISGAAVSDFRPKKVLAHKEKKGNADLNLELVQNPDILAELGKKKKASQILVGFAAETKNLESEASKKLRLKNLDMICANDVSRAGQGFASDENQMIFFMKDGQKIETPLCSKTKIAQLLLDQIELLLVPSKKIIKIK